MKRCILLIGLLLGASNLTHAMESTAPTAAPKTSSLASIKKYFNLPQFCFKLGAIFADDQENEQDDTEEKGASNDQVKEILCAFIDALYIGKLPLYLGEDAKEKKIATYFDVKRLKNLLKKIITDYFDTERAAQKDRLRKEIETLKGMLNKGTKEEQAKRQAYLKAMEKELRELGTYIIIKLLRDSLKMDALKRDYKPDSINIENSFEAILAYYENNPIEDNFIYLDKLPALFGYRLENACQIKDLKTVIHRLLKKEPITVAMISDCFTFQPMLRALDCEEETIEEINEGLHGLIILLNDLIQDKENGMWKCFVRIAQAERIMRDAPSQEDTSK